MPQYWMTMTNTTKSEIDRKANFYIGVCKEKIKEAFSRVKAGYRLVY